MTHELERIEPAETIRGEHIALKLHDASELNELLETTPGWHTLCTTQSNELPHPISSADLYAQGKTTDSDVHFQGNIYFSLPQDVEYPADWRSFVASELIAQIYADDTGFLPDSGKDIIVEVPHDDTATYIRISDQLYVRAEMCANLDNCGIALYTIEKTSLEKTLRRSIDPLEERPRDPYANLRAFSVVWTRALDSVASVYFSSAEYIRQHTIELRAPKEEPVPLDLNEQGIPEIESTTNVESFSMIGGLEEPKQRLQDVVDVFRDPEGAQAYGISGTHFLLHGPPGTGKTTLVEALAHELGADLHTIASSQIVNKYIGESARNAEEVFDQAIEKSQEKPVVLFFDEVDALVGTTGSPHIERRNVVKIMNTRITEIAKHYSDRIIIAAATNSDLDDLEPSIIRSGRLQPIPVPLPREAERVDIWAAVLTKSVMSFHRYDQVADDVSSPYGAKHFMPYSDDINPHELARLTEGLTGADFEVILERARRQAYRIYRASGGRTFATVSQHMLIDEIRKLGKR